MRTTLPSLLNAKLSQKVLFLQWSRLTLKSLLDSHKRCGVLMLNPESQFMKVPKLLMNEFDFNHRLESCVHLVSTYFFSLVSFILTQVLNFQWSIKPASKVLLITKWILHKMTSFLAMDQGLLPKLPPYLDQTFSSMGWLCRMPTQDSWAWKPALETRGSTFHLLELCRLWKLPAWCQTSSQWKPFSLHRSLATVGNNIHSAYRYINLRHFS